MMTPKIHYKKLSTALGLSLLSSLSLLTTSCENAGQGALSGAALGAAGGAIIGNQSGEAGEGAVIGGLGGAAVGGLIGNENAKRRQYDRRYY